MLAQVPNMLQSLASPDPATAAIMSVLKSPGSQAVEKLAGAATFLTILPSRASEFSATSVVAFLGPLMTPPSAASAASAALAAPKGALGTVAGPLGGGAGVSAGLGRAATVGSLSVPQSWATASPAIRLAATALPAAGLDGLPQAGAAGLGGWSGGMPLMGGVVNAPRNGAAGPRPESRLKVIPQMPGESGVEEGTPDRGMRPTGRALNAVDALSDRERYELHTLREEIAELAMERDAVDRLIQEAMRR
jgi:hypothetical protein